MSVYATPNLAAVGSLNLFGFWPVPHLINFLAEWVALIPFAVHLASYRHTHQLAGQVALLGRVSIDIFPKLGVLAGISRMVDSGPELFDVASTLGHSSRQVWDIKWGSRFLSANGAASSILTEYVLRGEHVAVRIPEGIPSTVVSQEQMKTLAMPTSCLAESRSESGLPTSPLSCSIVNSAASQASGISVQSSFRRYQTLHIIHFSKVDRRKSWCTALDRICQSPAFMAAAFAFQLSVTITLSLFGVYGTSATILVGAISQIISRNIKIQRPPEFLGNNEVHDACMLMSAHQNASTWYLFVGDRGIIDSLLNKPVVHIPRQGFVAWWFRQAHGLQLLAMTFASSQKGWDGVSLLVLLVVSTLFKLRLQNDLIARMFCESNGVAMKQETFEFSGRTCMLGAIQKISGCSSWSWMDDILVPCQRRDVWAKNISKVDASSVFDFEMEGLSPFDRGWVLVNRQLSETASEIIRKALDGNGTGRA